jgi:hypothetical protein
LKPAPETVSGVRFTVTVAEAKAAGVATRAAATAIVTILMVEV